MKKISVFLLVLCTTTILYGQVSKAPAYPLVTHDPYFSIWSMHDTLTAQPTRHWTGTDHSLLGLVKVDEKLYRFMGNTAPNYQTVLPAADELAYETVYTEDEPAMGWMQSEFSETGWKKGVAAFGDDRKEAKTYWKSNNLWVRRTFELASTDFNNLFLKLHHDDNIEVYLNGERMYEHIGWTGKYVYIPLKNAGALRKGKNVLAIHVANTAGGQWLDAGLVNEVEENSDIAVAQQKSLTMTSLQTGYVFVCGGIRLEVGFFSPLLLDSLALVSRPVSYVSFRALSVDGRAHRVEVYVGVSSHLAVHSPSQEVVVQKGSAGGRGGVSFLKAGTTSQPVLQRRGDDVRIDWGYLYVAAPTAARALQYVTPGGEGVESFRSGKRGSSAAAARGKSLLLNTVLDLGTVGKGAVERLVLLGYDDLYSVQYFGQHLRPWWREKGGTIEGELAGAARDFKRILSLCQAFDKKLYADALSAGGEAYAKLCVMAYRQAVAAHKLVKSPTGETLFLSKENFSNGSINTVDITYPSAPLFLLYNPELLKGMLNGIFYYSESGRWQKPFPAHDLGTYPLANGQTYGEDMPVEESGNMLILTAALALREGSAAYAKKHWKTLTTWAEFLSREGFDPSNQLSTDDFAGHLARNANLSVKAIVALRCYGLLAGLLGETGTARTYNALANDMVGRWMKVAADGDHYALAFGQSGTWSQKYNLVWDKVLGLGLFPREVYDKELRYYLTRQNGYGLPLDSRRTYTKSDWVLWTAAMSDDPAVFRALVAPLYRYATETTSRVPLSDWHETTTGNQVGFQARSVVGAYFIKTLNEKMKKSAGENNKKKYQ